MLLQLDVELAYSLRLTMATKTMQPPATALAAQMCQDKAFQAALATVLEAYLDNDGAENEADLWDMEKIFKESDDFKAGLIKGTPWREVFGDN
jgi:hypothetical protein